MESEKENSEEGELVVVDVMEEVKGWLNIEMGTFAVII